MSNIMNANPEAQFLAGVFATRLMLSTGWSCLEKQGMSELCDMQIARWDAGVVNPVMKQLVETHKVPSFAKEVVNNNKLAENIPGLHIHLLACASRDILQECKRETGLGSDTFELVGKWFTMMRSTKNSSLYENAPIAEQHRLNSVIRDFNSHMVGEHTGIGQEHPFFDPEIIFIYVAHLVFFYTKSDQEDCLPSTEFTKLHADASEMQQWEKLSGELFEEIFKINCHGLGVIEQHGVSDKDYRFAMINLPYEELKKELATNDIPSVMNLHISVMQKMYAKLSSISSCHSWYYHVNSWKEVGKFEKFCGMAYQQFEEMRQIHGNKDKNLKWRLKERKKQAHKKPYKPKSITKYQCLRDVFVMGNSSSIYFRTSTPLGRATKKFKLSAGN